jgi:uncharacterized SAM-binding protein YcdF (DUF218 family)
VRGVTDEQERKRPSFWLLRLLVILGGLYGIGFGLFVLRVPMAVAEPGASVERVDGIVALTGDDSRLAPAVALLERGRGDRLLITGVNPQTKKDELRVLLDGGTAFDCCADLGFEATDTRGNAIEAARWARTHSYTSLILVTSNAHMPRSLLEFSAQMPEVKLVPYAVDYLQADLGWLQRLARLNDEYAKFLASSARIALFERG